MPEQSPKPPEPTVISQAVTATIEQWKKKRRHTFDDVSALFFDEQIQFLAQYNELLQQHGEQATIADRARALEHISNLIASMDLRFAVMHLEQQNHASGILAGRMLFLTFVMLIAVATQIILAAMQVFKS